MNGTTVDGEAIDEDTALGPGATLKFGEVSLLFEPSDEVEPTAAAAYGTQSMPRLAQSPRPAGESAGPANEPAPPTPRSRSEAAANAARRMRVGTARRRTRPLTWVLLAVLLAAAGAAAYLLLYTP
jgi:hypothetical protein